MSNIAIPTIPTIHPETFTVESLLAMDDHTFRIQVTNDMHLARQFSSPFQAREVIQRTLLALIDSLWQTNNLIDDRAEDPNCPSELYEKTVRYRKHLLSVIDATERRATWFEGAKERDLKRWKAVLHQVIDAIVEGKDDDDILDIQIPGFRDAEMTYSLETWREIRRAKDPRRVAATKAAA